MPLADSCPVSLAVIVAKGSSEVILPRCYGVNGFEYFSDGAGRDGVKIRPSYGTASVGGTFWLDPPVQPDDVILMGTPEGEITLTWDKLTVPANFVCAILGVRFSQAEDSAPAPVVLPP